jgi:Carbohydrate binding module (family 35)
MITGAGKITVARQSRGRRVLAAGAAVTLAAGLTTAAAAPAMAVADTVTVNFGQPTGAFGGDAAGALYALSDDGVPSYPVMAGADPNSITTKPPGGQQHPGGDPLDVAQEFFATGGKTVLVNIQDSYPDWPYNKGVRPSDFTTYTAKITAAVSAIKAKDPKHFGQYLFVPFNEPDGGNWYGDYAALETQFLADWSTAYRAIKAVDTAARVAGPGLSAYNHARLHDLLAYAKATNELPDVITWHELSRSSLASYRANYSDYRAMEASLGVSARPINITEWGDRSDLSVPGQLIQWLAMLEATKVGGNTAYWTYAGNLNDNASGPNQANGGWWLLKWYADLTGSTVALTPPHLDVPQTVQGIATLDAARRQGTVLVGGSSNDITLNLTGLSRGGFGNAVDVRVRRAAWSGYEGDETQPPLVLGRRVTLSGGATTVTIPNTDPMSAYQVIVTPAAGALPAADAPWVSSIEAEKTTLTDVTAYAQDTDANTWLYATSGKADVGSTNKVTSALTWDVTVPATGSYRLAVLAGANKAPGQHALFVDGTFNQLIRYTADLGWTYRGQAEVSVPLTAGKHTLSVRMSKDGATLLPGSDIALDRFDLSRLPSAESSVYPARFARVIGTTSLDFGQGTTGALLRIGPSATAQFFLAAHDSGYYDLDLRYRTTGGRGGLTVTLNGRPLTGTAAGPGGPCAAKLRVHFAAGISELRVSAPVPALLDSVTMTRATAGDRLTRFIEAESGTVAGTARVDTLAASTGTNASGAADVSWLGGGSANTLTLTRPAGTPAGPYDLGVHYANAEQNTASHYNTDVISRTMVITETAGTSVSAPFRHNYSWTSFWWRTVPLDLTTAGGNLVLGNPDGWAPDIDAVTLSPLVLSSAVTPA